jgi:hypothetical protein
MVRKDFWKSGWFLGVAVAVAVLVISRTDFVQSMERKAYDLGVRVPNRIPSDRSAVIAIDGNSIVNTDRKLAHSVAAAGNVVLPVRFRLGDPLGRPGKDLPEHIRKSAVQALAGDGMPPVPASSLDVAVLTEPGERAGSIGHLNSPQHVEGAIRTEPLLLAYFDNQQTQERCATGDQMAKAFRECAEVFGMADVAL